MPNPKQSIWQILLRPWRWSRWTWAWAMPATLAGYFASAVPFHFLAVYLGTRGIIPDETEGFVWDAFYPAFYILSATEIGNIIYSWQWDTMMAIFGNPI